ncbi:MAG TPA: PIG-L family deacetylase [Abditibacteriaceae bacterium]|nr:PIG-L family deacetylase [Abditibacteriaceae bacterium]
MQTIERHDNYLFVFAHPDDEVYCCGLMSRLVAAGKTMTAIFLTSGDAGGNAHVREQEVAASMQGIGISETQTYLLRIPEKAVLGSLGQITSRLAELFAAIGPDCVVGMDYEGGHEVHDAASYATSYCLADYAAAHYVFPLYHNENGQRVAGGFLPSRKATDTILLTDHESDIKIRVLEAHRGQIGHFLHLQKRNPEYFKTILCHEIFRKIESPIDYKARPWTEIGYESHRNGFKFADFQDAIGAHQRGDAAQ